MSGLGGRGPSYFRCAWSANASNPSTTIRRIIPFENYLTPVIGWSAERIRYEPIRPAYDFDRAVCLCRDAPVAGSDRGRSRQLAGAEGSDRTRYLRSSVFIR